MPAFRGVAKALAPAPGLPTPGHLGVSGQEVAVGVVSTSIEPNGNGLKTAQESPVN